MSYELVEKFLTVNKFSRPGIKLQKPLAVVLHDPGVPGQPAFDVWRWFEHSNPKAGRYGSTQYTVDLDGSVWYQVPEGEVAYHCGSSSVDPASGQVYTDLARKLFGRFASSVSSPNMCSIGIEMCVGKGSVLTEDTYKSVSELVRQLLNRYSLLADAVVTHNMVVGWKSCPVLWSRDRWAFEEFRLQL